MRILIPGPAREDSFTDNVATTLEEMGHEVSVVRRDHTTCMARSLESAEALFDRLRSYRPSRGDRDIYRRVRSFRPDLFLALTWDVHPEVLRAIGVVCPGRRVLWWADAPANSRRWGLANPEWDLVYVKDPDALPKLELIGRRAHLLHEAMNPRWHRPLGQQTNDEVVVAGNAYASRQQLLLRLARTGASVALYGPKLPRWASPEVHRLHRGVYLTREKKSRVFGEALACLNSTSFAEGQSLNCRAFEVAGAGGLQLIEDRPIVATCFDPGRELLTFGTFEELTDLLDRARRFPREMVAIRVAGARRALAEHTYRHRLERILGDLSA